jgi:hypothetical protein
MLNAKYARVNNADGELVEFSVLILVPDSSGRIVEPVASLIDRL